MSEPLTPRPEIYRERVDSSSFGVVEKLLFSGAARDERMALMFHAFGSRSVPFQHPLNAKLFARALRVAANGAR